MLLLVRRPYRMGSSVWSGATWPLGPKLTFRDAKLRRIKAYVWELETRHLHRGLQDSIFSRPSGSVSAHLQVEGFLCFSEKVQLV